MTDKEAREEAIARLQRIADRARLALTVPPTFRKSYIEDINALARKAIDDLNGIVSERGAS